MVVRDRLQVMGVALKEGYGCPIYGEVIEDCRHLFFHWNRIYRVWSKVTSLWRF